MGAAPAWNIDDSWQIFSLAGLAEEGIDAYLQRVVVRAADLFEASGASIFLAEDIAEVFKLRATAGQHSTVPSDATIVFGSGVAGTVALAGKPRILGDLATEPGFSDVESASGGTVASSMVVPLSGPEGGVIGVLNFSRRAGRPPFVEHDLTTATALGSMVSLAASNACLVEKLHRQMAELQRTTETLEAVFDSVGSAVIVLDVHGRVVQCNTVGYGIYNGGWVGSDAIAEAIQEAYQRSKAARRPQAMRAEDPRTGRCWLVQCTPLHFGGAVLTVMDLTEHEAALHEAERLQRLAEIGQMTAAIAHEVRNPLTGILSAAQMVRQDPVEYGGFLEIIEDEVVKLNALCEDLLAFARPLEIEPEPTELGKLVRKQCELQKAEFAQDQVELTVVTGAGEPKMNLDQRRIGQVVQNLLRNAREACHKGGHVHVRVSGTRLEVEDDGSGMTQEQTAKLFTPFFTTKADGTGLGLCNVRRILEAHRAQIKVESEPGKGSLFTIDFERSGQ